MPVLVAEGGGTTEVELRLPALKDIKGSAISPVGEAIGVGRMEPNEGFVPRRLVLLDVGDARRESVLRKFDLRFGGGGIESAVMGNGGIFRFGLVSRSFWSSSTISIAVLVRVKL